MQLIAKQPAGTPSGSAAEGGAALAAAAPHTMQCLEVWGGNGATDNGVTMPGIDAWVLSRPHKGDEAGGDVHYVSSCGTGRISRILVADVAGHGTTVAELGRTLRSLMRRYMNYLDQTRLVEAINREFVAASTMGRFATAVVATYFAPTDTFTAVNAGHPSPLVYSSKKKEWRILEVERPTAPRAGSKAAAKAAPAPDFAAGNLPLGIDDIAKYEQFALRMRPGDLVVLYTDSLVEARRKDGSFIGEDGLLTIAGGLNPQTPDRFAASLYRGVIDACDGELPDDDVTVLVIRPNGVQPRMSFAEALRAQFTFLGMMLRGTLPGSLPVPWPEARIENLLGPLVKGVQQSWGKDAKEL